MSKYFLDVFYYLLIIKYKNKRLATMKKNLKKINSSKTYFLPNSVQILMHEYSHL